VNYDGHVEIAAAAGALQRYPPEPENRQLMAESIIREQEMWCMQMLICSRSAGLVLNLLKRI